VLAVFGVLGVFGGGGLVQRLDDFRSETKRFKIHAV